MDNILGNTELQQLYTTTYKNQANQIIKEAILYRKLREGEIYSQDSICSKLNISRTPVREALLELSREGYISFLRGRGIRVLPVDRKEASDIIELRRILEIAGCMYATERATQVQIEEIKRQLDSMETGIYQNVDKIELYKMDRCFHRSIFLATGNTWLLDVVERCRDHYLRFESQTGFDTYETKQQILSEHYEIYRAIYARDVSAAVRAMEIHLDRSTNRTFALQE